MKLTFTGSLNGIALVAGLFHHIIISDTRVRTIIPWFLTRALPRRVLERASYVSYIRYHTRGLPTHTCYMYNNNAANRIHAHHHVTAITLNSLF